MYATANDVFERADKRDVMDALANSPAESSAVRLSRLSQLLLGAKGRMIVSLRRRYLIPLRWPSTLDPAVLAAEKEMLSTFQVDTVLMLVWRRKVQTPDEFRRVDDDIRRRYEELGSINSPIPLSCLQQTGLCETRVPASEIAPKDTLPYLTDREVP